MSWVCLACREGRHLQCDLLRGCECVGDLTGRTPVLCAALTVRVPPPREGL